MKETFSYQIFGLNISSDFELFNRSLQINGTPAIQVEELDLVDKRLKELKEAQYYKIERNSALFYIPDVAIFLVENGRNIYYTSLTSKRRDHIPLYILGTCMGIILMQRRILPLHGSAISIDGKAYAIVGDSGAGKSTLASVFLKRGHKLLSDDVIPVSFSEEGVPMVTPAYPQQKLWQEIMDHFGLESSGYEPIIDRETKFKVPVVDQFEERQLPLAGVIELTKSEDDQIYMEPIQDLYRFSTLYNHTYRNFIIRRAGLMDWHFSTSSRILPHIDMFHMRRPVSQFTANELADKILSAIGKEESVV
ncbi:HPr kinase/phosphorylase [Halobacillus sp. K22]|uniref:HPr kinase/phosphorylase n=1 Tax=Halobacillus sp. K22 TaxID=3457431 RepID=UPI003FCC395F